MSGGATGPGAGDRRLRLAALLANAGKVRAAASVDPPFLDIGLVGLADALGRERPAIHLPLGPGLTSTPTLEGLAGYFEAEIRRVQPRGPYLLGGYCFGGLVALEAARRLAAAGEEIRWLLMVETPCPLPSMRRLRQLRGAALAVRHPGELLAGVRRRLGGDPGPGGIAAGDDAAFRRWTSSLLVGHRLGPFDLPLTLCFGARSRDRFFPRHGWRALSARAIGVRVIDARHRDISRSPALARAVLEELALRVGPPTRARGGAVG